MDSSVITQYGISLLTLTFLEIILGIDNLIFLSVMASRLPKEQQAAARRFGLLFALATRLLLLASVFWLSKLRATFFTLFGHGFSIRDLILIFGGAFLIYKATGEIHNEVVNVNLQTEIRKAKSMIGVIIQIGILDIIFSLDSVITAVGMTDLYVIMAIAIMIAIGFMIFLSEPLSQFINDNPTIKMLALSFLIMVGMVLVADGFGVHVPREYLYFSITFSLFVEFLNTLVRRRRSRLK